MYIADSSTAHASLCRTQTEKATHSSCQVADTLHLLYNGTITVHLYIL